MANESGVHRRARFLLQFDLLNLAEQRLPVRFQQLHQVEDLIAESGQAVHLVLRILRIYLKYGNITSGTELLRKKKDYFSHPP